MLLPWIESTKIFAHLKKYSYAGSSHKTGFYIEARNIQKNLTATFYTKGYVREKDRQTHEPKHRELEEDIPWQEYHACEHKLIALLYEGTPITKDALKNAPKNSFACGSAAITSLWTLKAIIVVSLVLSWLLSFSAAPLFISFFSVLFILVTNILSIKMRILFTALLIVPPIAEYFLFLRNPRSSIIEEGVELGKQIKAQLAEWEQIP